MFLLKWLVSEWHGWIIRWPWYIIFFSHKSKCMQCNDKIMLWCPFRTTVLRAMNCVFLISAKLKVLDMKFQQYLRLKCFTDIPLTSATHQIHSHHSPRPESIHWCAILIAHQLLWQNMEAPVSIFQESPLAGEPRERLFHIHSMHRYQLCAKYLYPSTSLWQMNGCNTKQQPGIIHWCYLFHCWKFNDV